MSACPKMVASTRTQRLVEYLWKNQRKEFRYGDHDCRIFAARWIDGELGTNYMERCKRFIVEMRGLAATLRAVERVGGYCEAISAVTGVKPSTEIGWSPGDIAVFRQEDGSEALGILSSRLVHCPGKHGLISLGVENRVIWHWSLECLRQ